MKKNRPTGQDTTQTHHKKPKQYDRDYFDRWYRDHRLKIDGPADLARKVGMVVRLTEYLLDRPIRTVLDIGCGEGRWLAPLRALRPNIDYRGIDSSEYAVERFRKTRGIQLGSLENLHQLGLSDPVDLCICADTLHYVPTKELRTGLATINKLTRGMAFLEVLTTADGAGGDLTGFIRRTPTFYRKHFQEAGFHQCGPHCWIPRKTAAGLAALEWSGE